MNEHLPLETVARWTKHIFHALADTPSGENSVGMALASVIEQALGASMGGDHKGTFGAMVGIWGMEGAPASERQQVIGYYSMPRNFLRGLQGKGNYLRDGWIR